MTDKGKIIKVVIFGEEYSLRGSEEDERHFMRVAECVDKKMREIALRSKNRSPNKIAVLTALNLADELLSNQDQARESIEKVEDRAKNILEMLDNSLAESE